MFRPMMPETPKKFFILCALLFSTFALSNGAIAGRSDVVVVIDAEGADLTIESLVRVSAEDALKSTGRVVAPLSSVGGDTGNALKKCAPNDETCVATALYGAKVPFILFVQLESPPEVMPDWIMVQTLYDTKTGERLKLNRRVCEGCIDPNVFASTIEKQTTKLLTDSESILVDDSEKPINVEPADNSNSKYGVWKYAAVGTGVAAIAGGITLILIDGPKITNNMREPKARATKAEGIALTGVGTALTVAGIWMFMNDKKDPTDSRVSASYYKGVGMLSFGGSF